MTESRSRRGDIEGLRGLAILLVVAYHAHLPGFQGGFVGVDIFFVLSGFLITGLLAAEFDKTGRIRLLDFYSRRARRLLPAAALMLISTFVAARLLLSPIEQREVTDSAFASAMYASNIWFGWTATDYIQRPPTSDPLLHMWSLAVEEQFYFIWPLVFLLGARWSAGQRMSLIVATAAMAFLSFTLMLFFMRSAPHWAFFASPARGWEFMVGGFCALLPWRSISRSTWWIGLLGALAVLVSVAAFDTNTAFPGFAALLPVFGTAAILVAPNPRLTKALESRVLQWFGKVSYSWYLWHWPVLVLAETLSPPLTLVGAISLSAAALGLSAITHTYVEDKVRFAPALVRRPYATIGLALITTIVTGAVLFWWRAAVHTEMLSAGQAAYVDASQTLPIIHSKGCHLNRGEEIAPDECVFGASESSTSVVLFGDSHAAQWFIPLERIAQQRGWQLHPFTKSNCPAADIPRTPDCEAWRDATIARIRALGPSLVVIGNASVYFDPDKHRRAATLGEDAYEGARSTLVALQGIPTVIMQELPMPGFDVPICLARSAWRPWLRSTCAFPKDGSPAVDLARDIEQAAADGLDHVRIVDLSSEVCRFDPCLPVRDGLIKYRDDDHLAPQFSISLADELAVKLDRLDWRRRSAPSTPDASGG